MVSRIAPTPSGYLHLGNAFNFLLTWLLVRGSEGKLLLRIDDMDRSRLRPEYLADIFTTIDWLGLDYDQGPEGPDDFERSWSQLHRLSLYREMLEHLAEQQALAASPLFLCQCSRAEILRNTAGNNSAGGYPGSYPGTCRANTFGRADEAKNTDKIMGEVQRFAIRINTDTAGIITWQDKFLGQVERSIDGKLKDFVLWKKDGFPAYQFSSLVDDLHFGVNTVVRGEDLIGSTAAQLFLASCIGATGLSFAESKFFHHPLIPSETGGKLSKSAGAGSVSLADQGMSVAEVITAFSRWAGMEEVGSCRELLQQVRESGQPFQLNFDR